MHYDYIYHVWGFVFCFVVFLIVVGFVFLLVVVFGLFFFSPKQIDEIVSAMKNIIFDINSCSLLRGKKFQSRTRNVFQSFQHQCQATIAYDWSAMLKTVIEVI